MARVDLAWHPDVPPTVKEFQYFVDENQVPSQHGWRPCVVTEICVFRLEPGYPDDMPEFVCLCRDRTTADQIANALNALQATRLSR